VPRLGLLVALLVVQLVLLGGLIWLAVTGFPVIGGGGSGAAAAPAPVDRFDGARAYALAREQVRRYGPRPAGSAASRRLAVRLRGLLPRGRFEPVPGHPGLRNVVGVLPGRRPAIVVGAHYDTEAQPRGFVGANDGASGTAVAVELARALQRTHRRGQREVRVVLFDGEEEPRGQQDEDFLRVGLRGSKAYVRAHAGEVKEMVLLDYVGDRDLALPREGTSDRALWAALRAAARRARVAWAFPAGTGPGILDDHTPFLRAGIPAIDLIDWDYPYRDTVRDTLDKISPRSLDAAGEAVLELLRERVDR
jgi:hypothetical protein